MAAFPFPIIECRGVDALTEWNKHRARGKAEGYYPVIVGDSRDLALLVESMEMNGDDPASIIERATTMHGADVLEIRESQDPELYENVDPGEWPIRASHQPIVSHTDLKTGEPKPKVYIAQLPTVHSHEVPAYLRYGAWNDCPSAAEHVAIHQMWHAEYGAEIVVVAGDVIECKVQRPPSTNDEATKLARQQFVYCSDIVYQGVQSLRALAAGLKNHDAWYFWWD